MLKPKQSELQKLYSADRAARYLFDDYATRQRNRRTTKVDWLVMAFSDRGLSRGEIIGMLRKLEALELGSYVTGRKGHPSRFEWKYASRDIAMMATGDETKTNPEPAPQVDEDEPEAVMHMHQFLLRTDLKVQFELPVDLTQAEAARLADYVKTLPLGG